MLVIHLFGAFSMSRDGRPLAKFQSRKSRNLLANLILNRGQPVRREMLAAQMWPDLAQERARKAFNTEYWRLGVGLNACGLAPDTLLNGDADTIEFRPQGRYWLDVAAFEEGTAPARADAPETVDDAALKGIEAATGLYRGDLLENTYDDWCLVQREAFRARYLAAVEFLLAAAMARGDWTRALATAQVLLSSDPLMEHVHRAVMRCHYHMGNRPAALRHYELCAQILRRELGVEPMAETSHVYDTIRAVSPRKAQALPPPPPPPPGKAVAPAELPLPERRPPLEEVTHAISSLDRARLWLVDASQQLKEG